MSSAFVLKKEQRLFLFLGCFFVANAIVAEFIGIKIFSVEKTLGLPPLDLSLWGFEHLSFNMSAGILNWPLVFVMTDLVNEYYGPKGVKWLTRLAILFILYAFAVVYVAVHVIPADFWIHPQINLNQAFAFIFGQSMWNIFASVTAFAISQWVDVITFHRIKHSTGEKALWLRATGSTVISQVVDTLTVTSILFYFNPNFQWPFKQVLAISTVGYLYKFLVAVSTTPVLYIAHRIIDLYLGKEVSEQLRKSAMLHH